MPSIAAITRGSEVRACADYTGICAVNWRYDAQHCAGLHTMPSYREPLVLCGNTLVSADCTFSRGNNESADDVVVNNASAVQQLQSF